MSNFIQHGPCPKCHSRDNLGEWDDGHKYCFGCGYYVHGKLGLMAIKNKLDPKEIPVEEDAKLPRDAVDILPKHAIEWLRKYDLTFTEIFKYQYMYSKEKELLIFQNMPYWWQGRYFGTEKYHPKYITKGKTDSHHIFRPAQKTEVVVLVEDIISAIKVGRVCDAIPLLGTHVPTKLMTGLSRLYKEVIIWLDADKMKEAAKFAQKCSQFVDCAGHLFTELDPKQYSTGEIKEFLYGNK